VFICVNLWRKKLLTLGLITVASGAIAQSYPTKPIRMIVPYAPGGGVDIIARTTAQELAKRVGQQIIVDNRTGAGGNVGSELVAKSAPDGYTLLMASPGCLKWHCVMDSRVRGNGRLQR
jgi:tripartite-type tricarboxylate transporter receptor subunit TctC